MRAFILSIVLCTSLFYFAHCEDVEDILTKSMYSLLKHPTYDHYRLPRTLQPQKYTLTVVTYLDNPENLKFMGEVVIFGKALEPAKNITLHAHNLTIDAARITLEGVTTSNQKNCISSTEVNSHHDYYIMNLCNPLTQGEEYYLTIPFEGILNQHLKGYYRSSYRDKATNETRWLAVTQFEPNFARAAFPCFDEPDHKAKFTVILGHQKKYTALSNMPLKETKDITGMPDWIWSEFEESVAMSTYLVAYTINDFAYTKSETNLRNKVQFRTWARPDAIAQCDYASTVGPKVLQYYEDIFDIKFPLEKIDQMAVPDFSAGAMENWGLVTYRETALLYAEKVSSLASRQRIASVIAHELAHQWFGNLVTMKWWTDLWLNEGFATYIASLGVEHISPEWKTLEEESVENTFTIFKVDSLKSSHPISQPIELASQIFEIFDSISYKKGSSVLRMMHKFLGDEAFHSGVTAYLKKHAYSNAEQDNLWSALTETAHKLRAIPESFDIKQIMDSWTLQTGYPVITIKRDYNQRSATLTQQRYLSDSEASRSEGHECWWIPLSYTSEKEANFSTTAPRDWLECDSTSHEPLLKLLADMPDKQEWVIFNLQMAGLYKVKYDENNWILLIETLMSDDYTKVHVINRAQLIDDALDLAWSGDQDYEIAMRLIEYLRRETEYIPWKAALDNLSNVNRILRQTPEYEFFKKYMRKILTPIYFHLNGLNDTTTDDENHNALHKVLIASWACRFDVEDCVPRAIQYFKDWQAVPNPNEENPIPTDLRPVVYCTAIRAGGDDEWHFLWDRYKASNVASEKTTIISALGCTREIWLLQRYLEWAFDKSAHIRKQDSFYAFGSVARGEVGYHLAKDYFFSNIEFLHDFYAPDTNDLSRLISPLASQMINRHDYDKMKNFTEEHKKLFSKSQQTIRRSLETIQINYQWKERNYELISERLRQRLVEL